MTGETIYYGIIVLVIVFAIFILTREFWCWYFKINERLTEQEKTNKLLEGINTSLSGEIQKSGNIDSNNIPEL